ncbi:MAG: S41 family peptidase, partial [Planctomycetota bacterium]|nr:S41 family peptidase [Planctomycetota bacterium]
HLDLLSYLRSSLRSCKSNQLRIAFASALWRYGIEEDDRVSAVESLNKAALSEVPEERIKAGFALAELNSFTVLPSRIIKILELIENEPSADGIRAKQVLEKHRLTQSLISDDRYYGRLGQPLLDEMIQKVEQYYVDVKFTNPAYLIESGARGIAGGLDRFSSYLGVKQWGDFKEGMSGTYAGIGAVLRQQGDTVIIERVFYTGPAYEAGIRSYDEILSFAEEGKDAVGDSKSILKKIRGKPGTKVTLLVRRYASPKDLEIEVLRKTIRIPSVYTTRLPGKIGYIKLTSFGNDSDSDFRNRLDELEQKAPIPGLIMDLRNNPGGLINAAQGIASLFLDDDKLIVYSEGRNTDVAPRREYRVQRSGEGEDTDSQRKNARRDYPLVVLINGQSASASEIVSGALQDHKRAKLVGVRTYGKGSVQQVMPLDSTRGTSALKLTVAKYYLPSGRSIHEVGLRADIEIQDQTGPKERYDREKSWTQKPFVKYVSGNMDKHLELFEKLAWSDNQEEKKYPQFESFYSGLETKAPRQYVRYKLRQYLRRMLSDRKGQEYIVDIVEDAVLKKGIETICKMSGIQLKDISDYSQLLGEGGND